MGKGGFNESDPALQEYCQEEVARHNTKKDLWIVIENVVYDVTQWAKKHPGGQKILANVAGQDATVCNIIQIITTCCLSLQLVWDTCKYFPILVQTINYQT